jgi:TonB-linked SusC/RagA family outer membrane protein
MVKNVRIGISFLLISWLALLLNISAIGQTTNSKSADNQGKSLNEIVKTLETKYHVSITIDGKLDQSEKNIAYDKIEVSKDIESALKALILGTDMDYVKMRDDYYVIGKKNETKSSISVPAADKPEKKTIKGTVSFKSDGSSIPGATILVKGTTNGVITDFDGHFSIEVSPQDQVLQVSYLGMKTVDLDLATTTNFNIAMEDDAFGLDEVIVSGVAAKTPRKLLSVSVDKVKSDELTQASSSSAASTLQGKVAGVTVVHANGQPGSGAAIRLRGSTSLSGANAPMIIMDGIILQTNLADINIDDIESMEVVKGAAAAALYGSRAGNGVIVITSKRGNNNKEGTTSVRIRQEIGSQEIPKYIKQATHHPYKLADDYQDYPYTKYAGVIYDSLGTPLFGSRHLTDEGYADQPYAILNEHQKDFYQKGIYNSTYASVTGNSAKTNFLLSYEYNKQEGVLFSTNGYSRNNFRVNIDHYITDKLKISSSNMIIMTKDNNPGSTRSFSDLLFISPDVDLTAPNDDGSPYKILPDPWSVAENPLYPLVNRHKESRRKSLIGNLQLNYEALDWLSFNTKYTYEYRNKYWSTYTPMGYLGFNGAYSGGSLYKRDYDNLDQNFQFTTNMNRQFGDFTGKVKLSYLYESSHWNNFYAIGHDFIIPDVPQLDNTDQSKTQTSSYNGDEVAINYFGILDADYKDKIILSALFREDASSNFGADVRWNPYYRFSLAYRLTEDVDIPGIQEFKIRASQGTSGQRPGYSWQYETYVFSNGNVQASTIGNSRLKPSETSETEMGFDMNFLKIFSLTFTYSQSTTKGAFAKAPLASHYGFPYQWKNIGELSSKVFEASLGMNLKSQSGFSWTSNLNFDRIRQKIEKLDIPDYTTGPRNAFSIKEGETFGVMYGYTWVTTLEEMANQLPEGASIEDYEVNNEGYVVPAGTQGTMDEMPIKLDANNDGLGDKVQIGDGNPDFQLNWGNTFTFKGFNFYMLWSWKNGGDVYNYTRQYTFRDQRDIVFDQTDVAASDRKAVNYYSTFYDGTGINSYFIEDGSYLKLRELSLYYSLSETKLPNFLKKYIKSFRIGFQARNLLTITNYRGYDPEVASGADLTNYPFDDAGYPNYRTYTGSISINF